MNDDIQVQSGLGIEQKTITVGFLNHYGYLSQLAQLGTNHKVHVEGTDYLVRIDKAVKLSIQHGHLCVNDIFKPDILLSYKTQGKLSYDLTIEALADDIPVHCITRYPKSLQQLLLNKHIDKWLSGDFDNNVVFKRVGVMCSNTAIANTLSLSPETLRHSHRWVFKPEFGAMTDNIFTIDGNSVNVPLLLNRFATERKDKEHGKVVRQLERLVEAKRMEIANGGRINDLNFKELYNGGIMAQEYVRADFEYRIIKKDSFKYDIYRRLKLNNNSYPYNDDVLYHFPICTINIGELDGNVGYLHTGGQTLNPEETRVFNSRTFKNMLECFSSPQMNFNFGSIDFFINIVGDQYNIGVYEFQPQYGVIDVYPDVLKEYINNILTFLIKTYLKGESNDSSRD